MISYETKEEITPLVYLRYGFISKIIFPKNIENIFNKRSQESQKKQAELRNSDPATLYHYLKFLCQYENYEYPSLFPNYKIGTWEDVEKFNNQTNINAYFRRFSSKKLIEKPHTLQKLKDLIDQFLSMVGANEAKNDLIKGGERKAMLSEEAKQYAIREIIDYLKHNLDKRSITYAEAFKYVKERAIAHGLDFADSIKETPVIEEAAPKARKDLKEIGINWAPKSGRPKNKKKHETLPSN